MLKPQELTEAITDYLQDIETEYAIMISGKWGCGKTYFWNKNIVPKLKEKGVKNIYISLYGVKTIDEIEQKILYELLNFSTNYKIKKSDTSSIIAEIPKYFDIILNKLDLGKSNFKPIADLFTGIASQLIFQQTLFANKDKYVICFDDLERLDPDLNIVKVLGYINQFVEHNSIKTVLICNEDEINSLEIYKKWKEKLVWYTYKISPSIEEIIDYFIKDYSEAIRNILVEHKKNIIDIKYKCNLENLRSLKICLNTCRLAFDKISQPIDFYDKLILLIFSLTIEIKEGVLRQEDLELLKRWIDEGYDFTSVYAKPKNDNEQAESSYLTKFLFKYYGDNLRSYTVTSKAIFDYIVTGYFNQDAFQQDINKINNNQITPQKLFLREFWELSNEKFTEVEQEYFEALKNCQIKSPSLLLRLCQRLFYFSDKRLILKSHEEISKLFKQSIANLAQNNLLDYEPLEDFAYNHVLKESDFLQENQYFQDVKQQVILSNKNKHPDTLRKDMDELVEILATDSDKFFSIAYKKYQHTQMPIFLYIDIFNFEKLIWKLSNSNLFKLRCFIANRYDSEYFNKWYLDEKPNLQKLKNLLDKHINEKNNNPQSLQCCLVAELRDEIDKVIKKIK